MPNNIKSVKIGVNGDPSTFKEVKLDRPKWDGQKPNWAQESKRFFQAPAAPPQKNLDPLLRPARVISRLKHNVVLSYMGEGMVIAPHSRRLVNDYEKLGALPKGITVVPVPLPLNKRSS